MSEKAEIRAAKPTDAQKLLDIYAYYVKNTAITYEYEVPSLQEFENRISNTLKKYPYLVAYADGEILGYAYASRFKERAAYGWDAEMTVYLNPEKRGYGIGCKLYALMEEILKAQGVVKAIAIITPPMDDSQAKVYNSVHFHEKMGYRMEGMVENCGYKFGRWYNTVLMDKTLNLPTDNMQPIKSFDQVKDIFGL